jgi:hypothetical protein
VSVRACGNVYAFVRSSVSVLMARRRTRELTQRYWWKDSIRAGSQPLRCITGQMRRVSLTPDGGAGLDNIAGMRPSLSWMSMQPRTWIDLPTTSSYTRRTTRPQTVSAAGQIRELGYAESGSTWL